MVSLPTPKTAIGILAFALALVCGSRAMWLVAYNDGLRRRQP